jgi:uncharacterized protein
MDTLTRKEIVEQIRVALETRNSSGFIDLFADDGILELPFAIDSAQAKYEGIDKIRERYGTPNPQSKLTEVHKASVVMYESTDPEVVTVEFTIEGKSLATGELYSYASSAGIIRVRNGKIIHYRDYPNLLGYVKIRGTMRQFAESLTK